MTATISPSVVSSERPARLGLLGYLRQPRRLRTIDSLGARLARLDATVRLLDRTRVRVAAGWTQGAWLVTLDGKAERAHVGMLQTVEATTDGRACLIGALAVEALPDAVSGPVVQQAIATLWSVLHGGPASSGDWSMSSSALNTARGQELLQWNDSPTRCRSHVLALIDASIASARAESTRLRTALATA